MEAALEKARASSGEDFQNFGQRQGQTLATQIQTSRSGSQMVLDVEDDPLHLSSNKVSRDPSQDPSKHPSQTQAVQSQESDSDTSLDLDKGGKPVRFSRNEESLKSPQRSTHHIANPSMNPIAQSDTKPASQNLNFNTESELQNTQSASPSEAQKYYKVETTEMAHTETTRIMRSFQQEKIQIEMVLKRDPEIHTLREKEEDLEDHETMLSDLIDELTIELKKTRGRLKRFSRRYRKVWADFHKD